MCAHYSILTNLMSLCNFIGHSTFLELAQGFGLVNSHMSLPNSECFTVHMMIMQYLLKLCSA